MVGMGVVVRLAEILRRARWSSGRLLMFPEKLNGLTFLQQEEAFVFTIDDRKERNV
jgi:hypothetical protein